MIRQVVPTQKNERAEVQCNICGKWLLVVPPVWCCETLILDKIRERRAKVEKLKWYLRQVVPLTYVTTFTENEKRRLCIWCMWLGHSFNIRYFDLAA